MVISNLLAPAIYSSLNAFGYSFKIGTLPVGIGADSGDRIIPSILFNLDTDTSIVCNRVPFGYVERIPQTCDRIGLILNLV